MNDHAAEAQLFYGVSDPGCVRENNEDRYLLREWKDGSALLAVVTDGMGGHASGEVAADFIVETFSEHIPMAFPVSAHERYDLLMNCIGVANQRIKERSSQEIQLRGMGATVVAAIITPCECIYLYAGDSRLYHIRDGRILHVTSDHSLMRILLDSGRITPEDVPNHPMRSIITSCLGGGENVTLTVEPNWEGEQPDIHPCDRLLEPCDMVMLCTDGLTNEVGDERLCELSQLHFIPESFCNACVEEARMNGGHDNITVVAVRIPEPRSVSE